MIASSGSIEVVEQKQTEIHNSNNLLANQESEPQKTKLEGDDELPPSPEDVKENIKLKFLVDMPDDFYQFWAFCQSICSKNTLGKLHQLRQRYIILI